MFVAEPRKCGDLSIAEAENRARAFVSSVMLGASMALWLIGVASPAFGQRPHTPQPFPKPSPPQQNAPARPPKPSRPPQPSATEPAPAAIQAEAAPTEAMLGVPIYPNAQFLASYDAGRGQRYYIFGSASTFVELVAYYRSILKQKGELVYDVPATHEFDVGRFKEDTMAFPPGVTIKDFVSDASQGYPNPKPGGQPARFPTIIQIVPVVPEK